jgi:plastocyanin
LTRIASIPADVSKRLLILTCAAALLLGACSDTTSGDVVPGSGVRFVPLVLDFSDNAGLGNAVTVDTDGVPYVSYLIFPAVLKAEEIPVPRPIGAPYIKTAVTAPSTDNPDGIPPRDGAAVGLASLAGSGVVTRGAAAQVQDTPTGIVIPYGPATEPSLIGATAENTNGTDTAVDAAGGKHVVWTGKDGVYYGYGSATGSFSVEQLYAFGGQLRTAGPIGRASVATDANDDPWVAYATIEQKHEIRVATKVGDAWTTTTVDALNLCNGCPPPGPTRIGITPEGPVVAYADPDTQTIKLARLGGKAWTSETVVSDVSAAGLDLAVGKGGVVYLSYYDGKGAVNLSIGQDGAWTTSKVADAKLDDTGVALGNFAQTTGVAVDDNATIYVSFFDAASDSVMLASGDGTTFAPIATSDTRAGAYPSVAVTPDGSTVFVTWYGELNEDLRMGVQGDVQDLQIAAPSPTPTGGAAPAPDASCGQDGKVALDIAAVGLAFTTQCLVADPGGPFTVTFDNPDAVAHNFDLLTEAGGDQIGTPTALEVGPVTQELKVAPLDPGTYYFQCDAHPTSMFGNLVVPKAKGK